MTYTVRKIILDFWNDHCVELNICLHVLKISQFKICAIYGCAENCGHELKLCANGQKVFKHRFCDGIIDCADESDESNCSCKFVCVFLFSHAAQSLI